MINPIVLIVARLLLLFLFVPMLAPAQRNPDTTLYGVDLHFRFHPAVFPATWVVSPINGRGASLDRREYERTRSLIRRSLAKYPTAVLHNNLSTIFVLKRMNFYGVHYGGTNSIDAIYLTNNGTERGYTDTYIEQTFHHEFSSILYRNYPLGFEEASWNSTNPPGFSYNDPEQGVGAIRSNQSSQELDTLLCSSGFLTQYALSGIENDINTFAQNLFLPSPGFWEAVERYPAIGKKTRIVIRLYQRIHGSFTEKFFRSLEYR